RRTAHQEHNMTSEFIARSFKSDRRTPLAFIWSHIRHHPIYAVTMIIGAFSNAALAAAVPYFIGLAVNAIRAGEGLEAAGRAGLAIIASQLLRAGLQLMRNGSAEIFAQRIERDVRDELYASLLGKSMTFHDLQPVGEIMARVTNDVRELNLMMNPGMNLLIGSGMFLITPVIASFLMYPALAIVPVAFLILYCVAQYDYVRDLAPVAERSRAAFGMMNAEAAEVLDGLQVVKGAAQEQRESADFARRVDEVRTYNVRTADIEARYLPNLLFFLAIALSFIHGVILYRAGVIDVGVLAAYVGQIQLFGFPVFSSLSAFSQVASGYASARRILNIINVENDLDQNLAGHQAVVQGAIAFENVSFGYTADGAKVLHDISFHIERGQTVAIVGQTGAGKTTITKLINRTYDVDAGRVLVDGVDVRDWNLASLRSQISVIEQDIYLFSRSIADNIRFGRPDATMDEVIEAAKKAQAHDFIIGFEQGYDTIVGQRGVTLSGGQRQRIAIARAFITDPPILILDDSTSAIDSATEDKIQQAIWSAARGRTTILITHRLSQIRWADHIIVLRRGRIVAQGKHDELLRSSPAYRRIFARYEGGAQSLRTDEYLAVIGAVRSADSPAAAQHPPQHQQQ
ncbi:MAG: ABC transporter ATP-binding protein/permease, partial [Anaerolinea sp.]|nr:ABC transporter ATP-binding protein/permease [Anaerolinea sp.]